MSRPERPTGTTRDVSDVEGFRPGPEPEGHGPRRSRPGSLVVIGKPSSLEKGNSCVRPGGRRETDHHRNSFPAVEKWDTVRRAETDAVGPEHKSAVPVPGSFPVKQGTVQETPGPTVVPPRDPGQDRLWSNPSGTTVTSDDWKVDTGEVLEALFLTFRYLRDRCRLVRTFLFDERDWVRFQSRAGVSVGVVPFT